LVIAPFLGVTPFTSDNHISGNMKSEAKTIHSVQVLDCRSIVFELL
jgi:hypothetical protein